MSNANFDYSMLVGFGSKMIPHYHSKKENETTMKYEFWDKDGKVVGSIDLFLYREIIRRQEAK